MVERIGEQEPLVEVLLGLRTFSSHRIPEHIHTFEKWCRRVLGIPILIRQLRCAHHRRGSSDILYFCYFLLTGKEQRDKKREDYFFHGVTIR